MFLGYFIPNLGHPSPFGLGMCLRQLEALQFESIVVHSCWTKKSMSIAQRKTNGINDCPLHYYYMQSILRTKYPRIMALPACAIYLRTHRATTSVRKGVCSVEWQADVEISVRVDDIIILNESMPRFRINSRRIWLTALSVWGRFPSDPPSQSKCTFCRPSMQHTLSRIKFTADAGILTINP